MNLLTDADPIPSLKGNTHGIFLSVMHPRAEIVTWDDVISVDEVVDPTVVVVVPSVSMFAAVVVVIHVSRLQ